MHSPLSATVEHDRAPTYNLMLHRPNMAEKRREREMAATLKQVAATS
jgi:hypothetical protein